MSNAAQHKPGEASPNVQLAILVGIIVLVLNAGFFFLSDAYYAGRPPGAAADPGGARLDFGIFTVVVGGAAILARIYPRAVAHGIAALAGLGSLLAAPFALSVGYVLPVTLVTLAGSFWALIWYSLGKSRAAWSCLAALCITGGIVMLFGAPKIRGLVGVGMWIAMIVPGLLWVATAALRMIRADYRDGAA